MKSRVLITGGSGLLALNWAIATRNDFEVVLGIHTRQINLSNTRSVLIDMRSNSSIKKIFEEVQPNLVINTAGLTNVEYCETQPKLARYVNVEIASNLATVCSDLGVSMAHISTDHLFSGDQSFLDEKAQPLPVNVYGQTKAEAELRILNICPDALVVRTNFYGWGTSYRCSFSDVLINALRSCKRVSLFKDVFYTPILAQELVLATHDLLKKNANGIFNVVGDERISKYHFGLQLAESFNLNQDLIEAVSINEVPNLVKRPLDMSLSNKKASDLLGKKIGNVFEHIAKLKLQENYRISEELKIL